jgi:hypothetical protein
LNDFGAFEIQFGTLKPPIIRRERLEIGSKLTFLILLPALTNS